ncbi:hypothetical protein MKW98_029853 [Papaver atlanticum]|uniref:Oligopeptide transporter n=1 Tax=Papaver atlanticum TaxID=357466 RepID=A0AAD4TJK6_9MAGN|nr:hypothetical protein MKW98_029853 [Papaver atlanticum]
MESHEIVVAEQTTLDNQETSDHHSTIEAEATMDDHSSVEEVTLVVPETDDPSLPVMTFRVWVLGTLSCTILICLNTFFTYRTQPLTISSILMQIIVLPIGRFMARVLPKRNISILGKKISLNPGPFNMKEHVIITIFANCGVSSGGGDAYSIGAITVMKAYYKQSMSFLCALLIVLTTQILGYGWAGLLKRYLVDPDEMWWPSNVAQVSLFRTLHEKDPNSRGLTRMKFFLIFMAASFVYYALPGYLFTILTFFSWVCWVWPHSITAQQIGSGANGLGIGAFTLDWAGISSYHGNPLVTPWISILNIAIGFIIFIYVIIPICYWKYNTFDYRKFPMFSNKLFTSTGQIYDTHKILTQQYDLNVPAYENYGKLYLGPLFALSIGSGFARFSATIVHVALFHGSAIWKQTKSAWKNVNVRLDIHAKLMKDYEEVPQWWYLILLGASIGLSLLMSFIWPKDIQLHWLGMLFAFALAFIVTLPIGVIQATTNQQPGYDIIAQFMFGYIIKGKPIASLLFKIYGRISTVHALSFLCDLKLGHYMKIPPKCMYTAQLAGTIIAGIVNLGVAWWMLENIENICDVDGLHPHGPWTCPKYKTTFNASVIWGLIGPKRLFGPGGMYRNLVWLYLVGAVLPVPIWVMSKIFPEKKWIPLINIPLVLYGFAGMPPASPTNIACWLITGIIFNCFVFKYKKGWWQKYNYVLSAALDTGTAFMGVLIFFLLDNQNVKLKWWGTEVDHCPLATCPTEPGIVVKGCTIFK